VLARVLIETAGNERYLLRDRDKSYGPAFRHRVRAMGITEVITAPAIALAEPLRRASYRFDPP
jgi:hypothetical protein